jgi:hypothetical protein
VRRMIRVLAVAVLVAMILVTSISPALGKKAAGGQLLSTRSPCNAHEDHAKNDREAGAHLINEQPPDRETPGCWVELPPSAND